MSDIYFEVRQSINTDAEDILKDVTEGIDISKVSVAAVFIAPNVDVKGVVAGIKGLFPFLGCTTQANFSKRVSATNYRDETVTVVYTFNLPALKLGLLKDIKVPGRKYAAFSVNDAQVEELISDVECFGGLAANGAFGFEDCAVFLNGEIYTSTTVAVEINAVELDFSAACGWEKLAGCTAGVVTKSDGLTVERINDTKALDFYKSCIPAIELFGAYPVKVHERNVFRCVVSTNQALGTLSFSGPIRIGESLEIAHSRRHDILNSVSELINKNRKQMMKADFLFVVSCAARSHILADMACKEYELIREMNPSSLMIYLHGEFKPVNGRTELENQHFILGIAK